MGFGKGGRNSSRAKQPKTKRERMDQDQGYNRMPRRKLDKESPMSMRKEHGFILVSEEHIRTYVTVAYVLRFNEPLQEEWNGIAAVLARELECDKRTVLTVFERIYEEGDAEAGIKAVERSGRPRKLPPNNPGLAAAGMALNSNLSVSIATEICNKTNEKAGIEPVSSDTVIRNLREYTVVLKERVLRRKTGKKDVDSDWAKARVARVTMTEEMISRGCSLSENTISMSECRAIDIPPLWWDAVIFIDQSHMRAVPAGANGHDGSCSRHQWRVALNAETGLLDPGGVLPQRLSQIQPKFDNHSQGCYAVCLPKPDTPVWLSSFNYTGTKMVSAKECDVADRAEDQRVRRLKGIWRNFNEAEYPYFEKYSKPGEENDMNLLRYRHPMNGRNCVP